METFDHLKNLDTQRRVIESLGIRLFKLILFYSQDERKDEKERTGIKILVRQIHSRNMTFVDVGKPSDLTLFFVSEKSARMEYFGHRSSQEGQNQEKFHFAGALSYAQFHVSVSGLQAHEDAAVAFVILAKLFNLTFDQMKGNFPKGSLPVEFDNPDSYLSRLLKNF